MASVLEVKSEKLHKGRKELEKFFTDHKSEDGYTFNADQLVEVKTRNEELEKLNKEFEDARSIFDIEQKNLDRIKDMETPSRSIQFKGSVVNTAGYGRDGANHASGLDIGKLFIESKGFKERLDSDGKWTRSGDLYVPLNHIETKTLFAESAGWAPFVPRISRIALTGQQQPRIIDLFPIGTTNAAAIKFMQETTYTNNAAAIAEDGTYPESAFVLTEVTQNVQKIGTSLPMTDEQLEDVEQSRDFINARLSLQSDQTLDKELFNGSGTAPHLQGITNVSGVQTGSLAGGDATTDAVLKGINKVQTIGFADPSGILMNNTDWMNVRLLKTADGLYIWGHPSMSGPATMWGLPVVTSTYVTLGTSVIGDFKGQAQIFMRRGLEFLITNSHGTDFLSGVQRIRCSLRAVLVCYRPNAFYVLTGL